MKHPSAEQFALAFGTPAPRVPRRRSYHVRSHQTVPEVREGEERALRQEEAILVYLQMHARVQGRWTPSEVAAVFPHWPVTSVRRALTNLTARGHLRHWPADRRPGPYGRMESTWSLA